MGAQGTRRTKKRQSTPYNYRQLLWVIATGVTLYVLGSFVVAGVGPLGASLSSKALNLFGGAVLLPLIHLFFELMRLGLGYQASHQKKQWLGTALSYLAITVLFTLISHSGQVKAAFLSPGFVGDKLGLVLGRSVGGLGLLLVGLVFALSSAFFYGLFTQVRLERWRAGMAKLSPARVPLAFERLRQKQVMGEDKCSASQPLDHVISPEVKGNKGESAALFSPQAGNRGIESDVVSPRSTSKGQAMEVISPQEQASVEDEPLKFDHQFDRSVPEVLGTVALSDDNFDDPSPQPLHIPAKALWAGARDWLYGFEEEQTDERIAALKRAMPGDAAFNASVNEEESATIRDEEIDDDDHSGSRRFWSASKLSFGRTKREEELQENLIHRAQKDDIIIAPEASKLSEGPGEKHDSLPYDAAAAESDDIVDVNVPFLLDDAYALEAGHDFLRPAPVSQGAPVVRGQTRIQVEQDEPVMVDVISDEAGPIPAGAFPPPLDLLGTPAPLDDHAEDQTERGDKVIAALRSFGVEATLAKVVVGPTIIQFQIQLARGVKVNQVARLEKDLALHLAVPTVRVEAPIEGTTYVGIELPNPKRRAVGLRTVLESPAFQNTSLALPLPLGQTVDGRVLLCDLAELPHLLVAGTTGSGKSIFVNNCITTLCYHLQPHELKFIMVDPKRVEMAFYRSLPHMLAAPVCNGDEALHAMAWAVREMERRYELFADAKARNLASYNAKVLPKNKLPFIVIIVDEFADLMKTSSKELEEYIIRLAQMARATGIHLILATQRPSADIITGTIKANIPARAAFSLPSVTDSRIILDATGAETLLGRGDMLFLSTRHPRPLRIQSPFLDETANLKVVDYLAHLFGQPEHIDFGASSNKNGNDGVDSSYLDDDRLREAVESVLNTGIASSSRLQRALRVGFTRAARMIDAMEMLGLVGPADGTKPREVLVDELEAEEILERHGVR